MSQTPNADDAGVLPHSIAWSIDRDSIVAKLTCTAPEGAPCRLTCPKGCPSWPCAHDLIDEGHCNGVEWIDATGAVDSWGGIFEKPLKDGPIYLWWDGDCWLWRYPDETRPPGERTQADG